MRVGNSASDLFPVKVELCEECVMSLWLFISCVVFVVKDVNVRVIGWGLRLMNADCRVKSESATAFR